MKQPKWTAKQRRRFHMYLRAFIQLICFVFLPSAFTSAFSGIKYLFTQIGLGQPIACTAFVTILLTLCIYTIVFGRFFCGYACAFGTVGDAVRALYVWICKKCHKKPLTIPEKVQSKLVYGKYIVLFVICLLCFLGVYGSCSGWSPWDVFSMVRSGNFHFSGYALGIVLLVLILIGMAFCDRFFCRFLCPMGAVFSLLPVLPFFTVQRKRENCRKNCRACKSVCPANVDVPEQGSFAVRGDCFQCQKCVHICPSQNVKTTRWLGGTHEIWMTILRAVILIVVLVLAGVS